MRTEVFGVIALGLLTAACSGADNRISVGGEGRNALNEATSGQAQAEGPLPSSEHVVRQAQSELKREGLYRGKVDGIAGPETKQAITAFRQREGLQQTARGEDGTVEGVESNDGLIVAVQCHPEELTTDLPWARNLFERFVARARVRRHKK